MSQAGCLNSDAFAHAPTEIQKIIYAAVVVDSMLADETLPDHKRQILNEMRECLRGLE